jgi:DNA polymerase-1
VTRIQRAGIPIDCNRYRAISENRDTFARAVIENAEAREHYGVYDGLHFRTDRFAALLADLDALQDWPPTESGRLSTSDADFKDMVRRYPKLRRLRECRRTVKLLSKFEIKIDSDGRSRPFLGPLGSLTGRNQPRGSIFGAAKWLRCLIQPPPGYGIALIDWSAQEIAIGGAMSGDKRMITSYRSGDPHIGFAVDAGFAPPGATAESHPKERALCKTVNFGLSYGQGISGFAARTGVDGARARYLVLGHRRTYSTYYGWRQRQVNRTALPGVFRTRLGWRWQTQGAVNPRTAMNFPLQAGGGDMMRLAAIAATEAGIEVCAVIHDAFLICAPLERLDTDIETMRNIMEYAGERLIGFKVRAECGDQVFRYPQHFIPKEKDAVESWESIQKALIGIGIEV